MEYSSRRPIRLLDGRRSQAIGILLKSLHVDMDEITQAVVAMETDLVDMESLKALNEMVRRIEHVIHGRLRPPLSLPLICTASDDWFNVERNYMKLICIP